jgi:hypothetical protein
LTCRPGRSEGEEDLMGGAHASAGGGGERRTPSRVNPGGPWAGFGNRPNGFPWPFLPFLFLFPFSFSIFLNCFKSFAKMLQTTSNKVLNPSDIPSYVLNQ